jgi:single-strand DNA-binding protein
MNETITTIVGNLVDEPNRRKLESGVSVTSFRVASTARRFDRVTSHWIDSDTLFLKVTCWRNLAENTERCLVKGDPVVVTGKLYTRLYEVGDARRAAYELEASAVGFDLNRGVGTFKRTSSNRTATVDEVGVDGIPTGGAIDAHLEAAAVPKEDGDEPFGPPPFGSDSFGSDPFASQPFGEHTFGSAESDEIEVVGVPGGGETPAESGEANFSETPAPAPKPSSGRRRGASAATA